MPTLSDGEFQLVYTLMTGALAALAGSLLYFVLSRSTISPRYHSAMAVASVVVGVAALHYQRLISAWTDSFEFRAGSGEWVATGVPFSGGLRYIDWLITVPLLLAQFVLVLRLDEVTARGLIRRLVVAASLMVAVGYPGEVSTVTSVKLVCWFAGFVPFAYIAYVLWVELSRSLFRYSDVVALTIGRARTLLVVSWFAYPIAYLFPVFGWTSGTAEVARQSIYSVADVVSKVGFGLIVYRIARLLTEQEASGADRKSEGQVDLADAGRGFTPAGM